MLFGRSRPTWSVSSFSLTFARLCLEIPRAGGRLLETGVEIFLKSKGRLGKGEQLLLYSGTLTL